MRAGGQKAPGHFILEINIVLANANKITIKLTLTHPDRKWNQIRLVFINNRKAIYVMDMAWASPVSVLDLQQLHGDLQTGIKHETPLAA